MKLYELTNDFKQVQALIEDGGEGLEDTLEAVNLAIEDKLENIAKVIKNLEGEANAFKEEEQRLADRRRSIENNVKKLKQYAENTMIVTGNKKIKAGLFTFAIQKNLPSVVINNKRLIPSQFFVPVDPRLDKNKIKEDLKNGESIPGVELKQGESLRIR